jgi:hypothetical protein
MHVGWFLLLLDDEEVWHFSNAVRKHRITDKGCATTLGQYERQDTAAVTLVSLNMFYGHEEENESVSESQHPA